MAKFFYYAMLIVPVVLSLLPVVLSLKSLHNSSLPLASHNSSLPLAPVGPPKKVVTHFEFFYLVIQWRGSYVPPPPCDPKTGLPPADFTIHGLWPSNITGQDPDLCDKNDKFDPAKINTDLIRDMRTHWPSFKCPMRDGSDEDFWKNEWERHGTCSNLDQQQFFKASLEQHKKLGALQLLANGKIKPNGGPFSVQNIKDAIKVKTNSDPEVECSYKYIKQVKVYHLYQIYVCLDNVNMEYCACPQKTRFGCGSGNIYLPPYK